MVIVFTTLRVMQSISGENAPIILGFLVRLPQKSQGIKAGEMVIGLATAYTLFYSLCTDHVCNVSNYQTNEVICI